MGLREMAFRQCDRCAGVLWIGNQFLAQLLLLEATPHGARQGLNDLVVLHGCEHRGTEIATREHGQRRDQG
jgi:hypothetical protein